MSWKNKAFLGENYERKLLCVFLLCVSLNYSFCVLTYSYPHNFIDVIKSEGFTISTDNGIPALFMHGQSYADLLNNTSNLKFEITNGFQSGTDGNDPPQRVVLKDYDIRVREIQTLVNERLQPGTYKVTFDGGMLPGGVYFYRLTTENFTETKKLILLK